MVARLTFPDGIAGSPLNARSSRIGFLCPRLVALRRMIAVVFNSPFSSFEDIVAEAKEEREQLSRLLTVSTPRERHLLITICLFVAALAVWLVFGNVSRDIAVEGLLVESAQDVIEETQPVHAVVWADGEFARQIRTGIRAVVELSVNDGETLAVNGEIVEVSTVPLLPELTELGSVAPMVALRVGVALDDKLDLSSLDGRECRVLIELEEQSPISLLGAMRS